MISSNLSKGNPICTLLLFLAGGIACLWTGCMPPVKEKPLSPQQAMERVHFFYPDFGKDDMDFAALVEAIERNLEYLERIDPQSPFVYNGRVFTCEQIIQTQKAFKELLLKEPAPAELNREIRKNFLIYRSVGRKGTGKVLFTGYFEPVYRASLEPTDRFRHPLYRRPEDLISVDLSRFDPQLAGKRIMGRLQGHTLVPYYTRSQIEAGKALRGSGLEIAWLENPVDVAFLHIQGSGRLLLQDGQALSVGYSAYNGRPYRSIGRYMIQEGLVPKEGMSMQAIRAYLTAQPQMCTQVLDSNPSYIFFRVLEEGPVGNIQVPLTPGRSLALDDSIFPKGALCFISCEKPLVNPDGEITGWVPFSRFVLNQDTGGAIQGAGRADLFWGSGPYAGTVAGHLKHEGELYFLIKKP